MTARRVLPRFWIEEPMPCSRTLPASGWAALYGVRVFEVANFQKLAFLKKCNQFTNLLIFFFILCNNKQRKERRAMIRLTSLTLKNFKNIKDGSIALSSWNVKKSSFPGPDIIGIYGQNGSGKTSVIQALAILKDVFLGNSISRSAADCVSRKSGDEKTEDARISVKGVIFDEPSQDPVQEFSYTVAFAEQGPHIAKNDSGPVIMSEEIAVKRFGDKMSKHTLMAYVGGADWDYEIRPKMVWKSVFANEKIRTELAVEQRLAFKNHSSLVFSYDFLTMLLKIYRKDDGVHSNRARKELDSIGQLCELILSIQKFAIFDFAIVDTTRYAISIMNHLKMSTHEGEYGNFADNSFDVNLLEPDNLTSDQLGVLNNTLERMNPVLTALVPGLSLSLYRFGQSLGDDGKPVERVQITCARDGVALPLRCESEGIKKLVSILMLLIDVYAKPGACVAVDELDSGIFEFLLGELLQVLKEHGRGQLIFTAHNLRPLEILDKGSLYFTTTNPDNRYIKFRGSRKKNNLRDQYLRAINLGGQPETVYESTNPFDIDGAFYDAGFPEED